MKNKLIIILSLLAIIVILSVVYRVNINVFNYETIKTVDIRTGDMLLPTIYTLDEREAITLFSSLSSLAQMDKPDLSLLSEYDRFDLTLLNKWELTKTYHLYFTQDKSVFVSIDREDHFYEIEDPSFFHSHQGFDSLYAKASYPVITIRSEQSLVDFKPLSSSWSFQRLGGIWVDSTPPLTDEGPAETLLIEQVNAVISVDADKRPTEASLKIVNKTDGTVAYEGVVNPRQLPLPEKDGLYDYTVTLIWSETNAGYRGQMVFQIPVDYSLPEQIHLSYDALEVGELLIIDAKHMGDLSEWQVTQNIYSAFKWYGDGESARGYLPTSYITETGVYPITLKNTRTGSLYTFEVTVNNRAFRVQKLIADETVVAETRNQKAFDEYNTIFIGSRTKSADFKYYDASFVIPAEGNFNTEFGETRTINGAATSYRHNGIDIGAPKGAPVVATNRGKVTLSADLILTGKTIVIDHGEGLFSVYLHLDERFVALDDIVERGQDIGTVGSTGFSTGPHLHFTLSYYNINLEPGYFLYGEPLTKEKYKRIE